MEVKLAKTAGFCFGVKRAVDTVYEQARQRKERLDAGEENVPDIYTFGPVIHNEEVVKDLEKKGVKVLRSEEELMELREGQSLSVLTESEKPFMIFWKKITSGTRT